MIAVRAWRNLDDHRRTDGTLLAIGRAVDASLDAVKTTEKRHLTTPSERLRGAHIKTGSATSPAPRRRRSSARSRPAGRPGVQRGRR
jgi:hypothetical protein